MTDDEIRALDEQGNVRHVKAYTAENPPAEGDVAWAHQQNPDLRIVGGTHVLDPERVKRLREEFDSNDQSDAIENGTIEGDDE